VVRVADDVNVDLIENSVALLKGESDEFSQLWMGDLPFSHREITKEEYLKLFDTDNGYLNTWTEKEKLKLINEVD
jgi:hypothetical protein